MKNLELCLSQNEQALFKNLIGKKMISLKHEVSINTIFYVIEIRISDGRYALYNDVKWVDDFYSGADDMPIFSFRRLGSDENPFETREANDLTTDVVEDTISDILLIQDQAEVYKNKAYVNAMKSTEGIVFITGSKQYGIFKDNMWLDEEMWLWEGTNVITKMEPLAKHFAIFSEPYWARCQRTVTSLKDSTKKQIAEAIVKGDNSATENCEKSLD